MRAGYSPELKARVLAGDAKIYTELVRTYAEDLRDRQSEWDAAATMTNVESWPDGFITLAATNVATISYTTGSDHATNITGTRPFEVILWELDDAIGDGALLRAASFYLTRRRSSAADPFDGHFQCRAYTIKMHGVGKSDDLWYMQQLSEPVTLLAASMTADTELVEFAFGQPSGNAANPPPIPITEALRPIRATGPNVAYLGFRPSVAPTLPLTGRCLVFELEAIGGSNTNYAWEYDSAASAASTTVGAGRIVHRTVSAYSATDAGQGRVGYFEVSSTTTGQMRATLSIGQFPATGTVSFTGATQLDLGASPSSGDVEFVVRKAVPSGTSVTVEARASSTSTLFTIVDGDLASDVGLPVQQTYEVLVSLNANSGVDVTPIVYGVGVRDRTRTDITDLCDWPNAGYSESADPLTGRYALPEARLPILHTGTRDYLGLERLFSDQSLANVQLEALIGHPDLARTYWLMHSLWDVDDITGEDDHLTVVLVSAAMSALKGRYPTSAGTLYGYLLKSTAGTDGVPTGTGFGREMSEGTESGNTITISVASGVTSTCYAATPPNVPNLSHFPTGPVRTLVQVSTATSTNILLKIRWQRINSTGTVQESSPYTAEQRLSAAGSYAFSQANVGWTAGAVTDRWQVEYSFRNDHATASKSVTIDTGAVNSETRTPNIKTTQTSPATYSLQTVKAVFSDWISQVGLSERYIGQPPYNTTDRLSKSVYDVDGKEELERIARCAAGTIADVQGKVCWAPMFPQARTLAATIPLETFAPSNVTMGYRQRLPQYTVKFGWDGGKFAGERTVKHDSAFTALGLSRVENPNAVLDDATSLYIPTAKLAADLAAQVVQAVGAGMILIEGVATDARPELTIGDPVAIETDRLFGYNPFTSAPFRGPQWALGRVIGIHDMWGKNLSVWVPGLQNLVGSSGTTVARQPFEVVRVALEDQSLNVQPQNARFRLRSFPHTNATIYYYYHATGDTIPEPGSYLWTAYVADSIVTVVRDPSSTKYLTAYGSAHGLDGPRETWPVPAGAKATIGNLVGSEASTSLVSVVAGNVSDNCRSIRYYAHATSTSSAPWPTTNGASTGTVSESYFISERGVDPSWGGFDASGNAVTGGLVAVQVASAVATGMHVYVIAVPLDGNSQPGTNKTLDYTWAGATSANVSNAVVTLNAAGSAYSTSRSYDVTWSASAVVTATDSFDIYATVDGGRSLVASSTLGVSTVTGIAIGYYPSSKTGLPDVTVYFDYEVTRAAVAIATGVFTPYPYETFQGAQTI